MYAFKSYWFTSIFFLTQPIPARIGSFLRITFPSDTPSFILCTWLYSMLAELIAVLAKIYFSLSTFDCYHAMPALCLVFCIQMWKQDPTLSDSGRILLHLCALPPALKEPAISLPFQLMKMHFFHQVVFSETAQIFTCSFSCKAPIG